MDIVKEDSQRREFRDILFSLAESQEVLRDPVERSKVYKRLEDLYHAPKGDEEFRHFYSDIFAVLTMIKQGDKPGSIDVLGQNLLVIRKGYRSINSDKNGDIINIDGHLKKLYDHVSLDIARMGYSDGADRMLSQEANIADLQAQVNSATIQTNAVQERLNAQESDLKSAQKEYIAILGIFASVVLTFTAGIAFSTSVLQNLHTASIYRIICSILLIGIVLANVLFGLFYYIDRLVNKPDNRKIKPLIITNIVLICLLLITTWGWYSGVAEKRNSRIEKVFAEDIIVDNNISSNNDSSEDSSSLRVNDKSLSLESHPIVDAPQSIE